MKSWPIAYSAELAKKTGLAPVWILKISAGGNNYYLSDQAVEIVAWSVTTLPWVASWGEISEGLSGALNEIRVSDFELELLVDQDATPNMADLATGYDLEEATVSLYLWPAGTSLSPREIARFYADDIELPDETSVRLVLVDESSRLQNYVGNKVALDVYPDADPDDVGKLIPIPFGQVSRIPALAVQAGSMTGLGASINAAATTVYLTDTSRFSVGDVFRLDDEELLIGGIPAAGQVTVTRAHNGTIAVPHAKGGKAWQVLGTFDYLVSDVPVDSLDKVIGKVGEVELDITSVCTLYTGQAGDEHPTISGKAVVSLPGYVTVTQAVDLIVNNTLSGEKSGTVSKVGSASKTGSASKSGGVTDGISVNDTNHNHNIGNITIPVIPDIISAVTGTILNDTDYNCVDGNQKTFTVGGGSGSNIQGRRAQSIGATGIPYQIRACVQASDMTSYGNFNLRLYTGNLQRASVVCQHDGNVYKTAFVSTGISSWSDVVAASTFMRWDNDTYSQVSRVWFEVSYATAVNSTSGVTKSGTVSDTISVLDTIAVSDTIDVSDSISLALSGGVTLSGNSTANTLVGDQLLVDVTRSMTVVEAFDSLLSPLGFAALQVNGSLPASYALDGVISEYNTAHYWLDLWAFQLRSRFLISCGAPRLIVRPDVQTSVKAIPQPATDSNHRKIWSRKKTALDEVVNNIQLLYDRDWSLPAGDGSYRAIASTEDSASVAIHGRRERPELWLFDFVTSQDMAESLRDFYLAKYAVRRWLHEFKTFLDHAELETGDGVTLGWDGDTVGEVTMVNHAPGDVSSMDMVGFVVEV